MTTIERRSEGNPQPTKSRFTPRVLGGMFVGLILAFVIAGFLVSAPINVYLWVTASALTPWFLIICFYFARDRHRRLKYLRGR